MIDEDFIKKYEELEQVVDHLTLESYDRDKRDKKILERLKNLEDKK